MDTQQKKRVLNTLNSFVQQELADTTIERTPEDVARFEKNMHDIERSMRLSRVINRDYVRRWALDYANDKRYHKFSRVSESFLNAIEAATKAAIRERVNKHGSRGVTLT